MAAEDRPLLRPLELGDVLDGLFALYRRGFKTFIGIAALVHVPFGIVGLVVSLPFLSQLPQLGAPGLVTPDEVFGSFFSWLLVFGLLAVPVLVVGAILEQAATCYATSAFYLGQSPTIGAAYRWALDRFWALLRLGLLLGAIFLGLIVVAFVPVVFPPLLCISVPGVVVAAVYLFVRWVLATPVLVLEGRDSAIHALERSAALVQGAWWRTFVTLLILAMLIWLLQSVSSVLIAAVTGGFDFVTTAGTRQQPLWGVVVSSLLNSAMNVLFAPFYWIALTLLYYDRRVRTEAYDLTVLARELAQEPSAEG